MKPYPDQERSIQQIMEAFEEHERVAFSLSTGGGKTACFSFIAQRFYKKYKRNALVLAHRDVLISQTLATLRTIGMTAESVVASKKKLQHHSQVYVAMVQTIKNRLRMDPEFVRDIGLIICDEAHLLQYEEVLNQFPEAKILAVSATFSTLKKVNFTKCSVCKKEHAEVVQCCGFETYEYTRKFAYSEIYGHLVLGDSISELILKDRLVRDLNYEVGNIDRNSFEIDSKTGDFDTKSTDKYFGEFNVVKNYEEICKGEKTLIFSSSTTTNLQTYQFFLDAGYDVRMLDSKNTKQSERGTILEWFKNTPDAILLNCGVLTAGFDEPTIQAVILNRATLSLALYLQMVGRGGRKCETIYKPHFKVIDGGGNIQYFKEKYGGGKWSDEYDWESIFYGTDEKPKAKKEALDQTKQCSNCDGIIAKNSVECMYCGFIEVEVKKEKVFSDEVAVLIDEIPRPNGKKIVQYVQRVGKDKSFAWTILTNQILDMFIRHEVTFGLYSKTEKNGKFEQSMRSLIKEPYASIQCSELEGTKLRTKAYIVNRIKKKLDQYYSQKIAS